MQNLGKNLVRTHYHHFAGGEHDRALDSTHEARQTVYLRADGSHVINHMSSKRVVTPTADGAFECVQRVQAFAMGAGFDILADINRAMMDNLATVMVLESGDRWVEIDNDRNAEYLGRLSQTAVGMFYRQEGQMEDGHPRRWFVLVGDNAANEMIGKVTLSVLPEGAVTRNPGFVSDCHIVGFENRNPYPLFADEIDLLAQETGLPITPNYAGRPLPDAPLAAGFGR